ncbi:MAG: phosphatase [Campylobacterales bacterium]
MIGIDLGSNTLRIVQLDCATGQKRATFERIVRTAEGLVATGTISNEAIKRIIQTLLDSRSVIDYNDRLRAVCTEAMRRATNSAQVLESINHATGILFEIIDPHEEARLTALAVRKALGDPDYPFVLVDIGGGSTEVIFSAGNTLLTESFPIGILTLTQSCPSPEERHQALISFTQRLTPFLTNITTTHQAPRYFVSTAGTPTTLAAMKLGMDHASYDPQRINGSVIDRHDILVQKKRLLALDPTERAKLVGVGREDLILTGIEIFETILQATGFDASIVIDDGLREGAALSACMERQG